MLTVVLLTGSLNLAYAETPANCDINDSVAGIALNTQEKSDSDGPINTNVEATNFGTGQVPNPCQIEVNTVEVKLNGASVCLVTGLTIPVLQNSFATLLIEGGGAGTAGECKVPAPNAGPWVVSAEWTGRTFNVDPNLNPDPDASTPDGATTTGATNLVSSTISVDKVAIPIKARINPEPPGGTVNVDYLINVANTGTSTIFSCTLTDANAPAPIAAIGVLNPGDDADRAYSQQIGEDTANTVFVTCLDQFGNEIPGQASANVDIYKPAVQIIKDCDDKVLLGTSATCTLTITNESPDDPLANLSNCIVTDPAIFFGPTPPFVLGDTPVVFGPLVTPPINEPLVNTAFVTCEDQGQNTVDDSDTVTIVPFAPSVLIDKNVNTDKVAAGDTVIYSYQAANDGVGDLTGCLITDDKLPAVSFGPFDLAQGATSAVFNAESDPIDGETTNIATVICKDQLDNDVDDTDTITVNSFSPSILVEKVCTPDLQQAPGTIDYTITVTNTSNDAKLFGVVLLDADLGLDQLIGDLDPLQVVVVNAQRPDLPEGTYVNIASASGLDQLANTYQDDDDATCVIETIGQNGCTPGYWKSNAVFKKDPANAWTVEAPGDTLEEATFMPQSYDSSLTLLDALSLNAGETMEGQLLRHCVAAKLNAENALVPFAIPTAEAVIAQCNEAMATENESTMEVLKNQLDDYNNAGCSINMKGEQVDPE